MRARSRSFAPTAPSSTVMNADTNLHKAAKDGNGDECKDCVKDGDDVNAKGAGGRTAIMRAVNGGFDECTGVLLELGADTSLADARKRTVLHYVALAPKEDLALKCLQMLFERSPEATKGIVNGQTKSGTTALHCVAEKGYVEMAKLLLEHGANPALLDEDKKTAFDLARANGHKLPKELISTSLSTPRKQSVAPGKPPPTRRGSTGSANTSSACIIS